MESRGWDAWHGAAQRGGVTTAGSGRSVRVGVLGAARIVEHALLTPAADVDGLDIVAIAARDRSRASTYAAEHSIPRVLEAYEDILAATDIDAVYIPTPAALHGIWMRRAIKAGKHVLCEKPFTANADEAAEIAPLAEGSGLVIMEALHSRYHPMWPRIREHLRSGEIGSIQQANAIFTVPIRNSADIRWRLELGGGALMDLGYYPLNMLRYLFGEPTVTSATAVDVSGVDALLTADLAFPDSVAGRLTTSMREEDGIATELRVIGSAGEIYVQMPYHPHMGGLMTITTAAGAVTEEPDPRSTYFFQLLAFRDAVRDGGPILTGPDAATAAMRAVDAIYRAAGMSPRQPAASSG
jgi:predicted dehydrogenase